MSSPALRAEIQSLVDAFVRDLEDLVRRAALETVAEALGSPAAAASARKAPRAAAPAPSPRPRGKIAPASGRVRRSADAIAAVADRIVAHVEASPGARAEEIRSALGLPRNEWTSTVKRLTDAGRLVTKGEKRATTYFARGAGRPGVIKRPGRSGPVADGASEPGPAS